mmetsp:Transcript_12726/g.24689  ORF Transcript_12726/g.24689 Transcript_12726/m.24689 type:complete len:217 (+) Transcript_12726:411-1061(+)
MTLSSCRDRWTKLSEKNVWTTGAKLLSPDNSSTTPSRVLARPMSLLNVSTRSPLTRQHMQPLGISTTSSALSMAILALSSRKSLSSMLSCPTSFSITAIRRPLSVRILRNKVVLPAPRMPVSTTQGNLCARSVPQDSASSRSAAVRPEPASPPASAAASAAACSQNLHIFRKRSGRANLQSLYGDASTIHDLCSEFGSRFATNSNTHRNESTKSER